jgi:hypothetical protein
MEITEGQKVVPSIRTKASPPLMAQLTRKAGLCETKLCDGQLKVRRTDEEGHAVVEHPELSAPFRVHTKFLEPAPER